MSKLKIANLSFCETDLNNDQVHGGFIIFSANRFLNTFFPELKPLKSLGFENDYKMQEFYDPETDSSGMIISKETDNGRILAGIFKGNLSNGSGKYKASFARASSFDMPVGT